MAGGPSAKQPGPGALRCGWNVRTLQLKGESSLQICCRCSDQATAVQFLIVEAAGPDFLQQKGAPPPAQSRPLWGVPRPPGADRDLPPRSRRSSGRRTSRCTRRLPSGYLTRPLRQQTNGRALNCQWLRGLFIERHKDLCPKPASFVRNDAIGEIAARVEHSQTRLHCWPVDEHIGAVHQASNCFGYVGRGDFIGLGQHPDQLA
jgi:hypothetical protein